MKLYVLLAFAATANAFSFVARGAKSSSTQLQAEGRINSKIDLDSPKVATLETLSAGKKVYCRCWQSDKFPLCDGAHMKHNEVRWILDVA